MSFDPQQRRNTGLTRQLKQQIVQNGPLSIAQYMHSCLQDETHGYYRGQTAIGAQGDFITAPEISQVFGELIGLWCAVVWQQMGAPANIKLIELGPGRGTLLSDALRAARILPNFIDAISLHLVESSEPARSAQHAALLDSPRPASQPVNWPVSWYDQLRDVPPGPAIVIGNEFLDVLPVEQFVARDGQWHKRAVGLDSKGQLCFTNLPLAAGAGAPERFPLPATVAPSQGTIKEVCDFTPVLHALYERAGSAPLAALFLDYGYLEPQIGDTLQSVRAHCHEHPLCSPGEADITCYVNFHDLATQAYTFGAPAQIRLSVDGPITQGEFLGALGIAERASLLMNANKDQAGAIEMAVARLLAPQGMGARFKAMGLRSACLPQLPGLPVLPVATSAHPGSGTYSNSGTPSGSAGQSGSVAPSNTDPQSANAVPSQIEKNPST